jgi:hypothetical protein
MDSSINDVNLVANISVKISYTSLSLIAIKIKLFSSIKGPANYTRQFSCLYRIKPLPTVGAAEFGRAQGLLYAPSNRSPI